jgi:peptide/nickel transport system ATP-binding protein
MRVVDLPGMPTGHRVACHFAEEIERGEITPHEVAPVLVAPDDDGMTDDPFMGPASVTEVL